MTESIDIITKRLRTPNDQYTCMSAEQLRNIKEKSQASLHFFKQIPHVLPEKRFYKDRYVSSTNQFLFRDAPHSYPVCWLNELWQRDPPEQHNTCRLGASLRWGPEKNGSRTYSHFGGEDTHRYLNIDVYRRPPTNMIGPVTQRHGRATSYYHQRNPYSQTWFCSNNMLNQTDVLKNIQPKTLAEYQELAELENRPKIQRIKEDLWPQFSEYVHRYSIKTGEPRTINRLETNKRHVQSALPMVSNP